MSEREHKDQLWSEATLWFARMRSPDAEEFRPEFEEWLARGALHRRYYNRASEHWLHGTAAYAEERAQIHGIQKRQPAAPPKNRSKRGAIAALIAASVVVAGSSVLYVAGDRGDVGPAKRPVIATQAPTGFARFATAAGEQRGVRLVDGSIVMLGSDTFLRVQFGTALRRLELARGKARFEVAHEVRPFVVLAGGGSVTAHGTVFDVGVSPDHRVSVRLIKGSIDVQLPPSTTTARRPGPRRLRPGEALSFDATMVQISDRAPAAPASAPVEAARDYRSVRVADIVGEANRRAVVPIRFADPTLGAQMVSGRFRTDDTALLAERLAALFDLVVERGNSTEIVLRPK